MVTKKTVATILAVAVVLFAAIFAAGCTGSDENTLVVGTSADFPPWEYMANGADGQYIGIDMDIVREIANDLGMKLKIENITFDGVLAAVSSGKVSFGASAITANEDRRKNMDFSITYASTKQVIIVNPGKTNKKIETADDLVGARIGVQAGTTGEQIVRENYEKTSTINSVKSIFEAFMALQQNKNDAVVVDEQTAKVCMVSAPELVLLEGVSIPGSEVEEYAFAFKKDSGEIFDKVNASLQKLIDNGTIDKIVSENIAKLLDDEEQN